MNRVGDAFVFTKLRNSRCTITVIPTYHEVAKDTVTIDDVEIITKGVNDDEKDFLLHALMLAVEACHADGSPTVE